MSELKNVSVKRFYKQVALAEGKGGFAITLDGREAKTVGRHPLATQSRALAEALVVEWDAQQDEIDLAAMPLTRLQGFVLDGGESARGEWQSTILSYAGSDLLCYRADDPPLAKRQADLWQPPLDAMAERLCHAFAVTEGVIAVEQPAALLSGFEGALAQETLPAVLSLKLMTEMLGSAVLALCVRHHVLSTEDAFAAARLDETYQAEKWGVDAEAAARDASVRAELEQVARFMALSFGTSGE